ncbi:unnamed protein product, partial [Mesorhabditis belari]
MKIIKWECRGAAFRGFEKISKKNKHTVCFEASGGVRELTFDFSSAQTREILDEWAENPRMGLFPWVELRFDYADGGPLIKLCWLVFRWNRETSKWIAAFTVERPIMGGFELRSMVESFDDMEITRSLTMTSDIKFDQTLLHFTLKNQQRDWAMIKIGAMKPMDFGIRVVLLDREMRKLEDNPTTKWFSIKNITMQRVCITFRGPRAASMLIDHKTRFASSEWPYFELQVRRRSEGKSDDFSRWIIFEWIG